MDDQSTGVERFSVSAIFKGNYRSLYTHRLQWYRWLLQMAGAVHIIPTVGKLYWHYSVGHTPSVRPDFFAFCLSVAARVTWTVLFRDPAEFLGFRRTEKPYRWVVLGTVATTTLPNLMVHIWALKMALKKDGFVYSGRIGAISALVFLVPLIGFVWWMAWTFLLAFHESSNEFEPTAKTGATALDRAVVSIPWPSNPGPGDYLAQLYEEQRLQAFTERPSVDSQPQSGEARHEEARSVEPHLAGTPESAPILENVSPPRCRTAARLEYMSQAHFGPHAWLSFLMVPLVFSAYATVLLVLLPIFIHEDRELKLRPPTPTVKRCLYFPLGLYLFSFYALKHRVRVSLFERFDISFPEPWREIMQYRPWRSQAGPRFCNMETGETTAHDPRRRSFPPGADKCPELVRARAYLEAYNANPGACTTYWGHSGRAIKGDIRFRPTIYRVGFVILAAYFVAKGYYNTIFYDVPNPYEEIIKHPNTITMDDIKRIVRLTRLWQACLYSGFWFIALSIIFVLAAVGSITVAFFRGVWKFVPQEEKDAISARWQEQQQISRIGRIRLE